MKIYKVSTGTEFEGGQLFAPYANHNEEWMTNRAEAEAIYNAIVLKDFDNGTVREDGEDDFQFAMMEGGRPLITLFSANVMPSEWKRAMWMKANESDWCDFLNCRTDFDWTEEKERHIDFPQIDVDFNYLPN